MRASRWRLGLLALLGVMAVLSAVWWWGASSRTTSQSGEAGPVMRDSAGAEARLAEVQGRLWLEETPEGEVPDEPVLVPADRCVVRVWRSGVEVAAVSECDAQGRYAATLTGEVFGRVSVELESPGRLRAMVTVDVPEGGTGLLPDVAVGVAQSVEGHVVDAQGGPVVGVVVEARPVPDLGEPEPWRRATGPNGEFVFDTLPPGPVTLRCVAEGYAPTIVEAIAPQSDVLVRMSGLHDMRGRVVAGGAEVDLAGATVRLEGSGVWPARHVGANADGVFVFEGVPDGVYAVEAMVAAEPGEPGWASVPLEGVEPDLEVSLALVRAHWVRVRVEDPTGAVVGGARVTLMNAQVGMLARTETTDDTGQAWVGPLVPGSYVVRADADGFLRSKSEPVLVTGEGAADDVVVRLERPGRLVVSVVGPGGAAAIGAQVSLRTDSAYSMGEAQTRAATFARKLEAGGTLGVMPGPVPPIPLGSADDATTWRRTPGSGLVAFDDLLPGVYTVTASHPDHADSVAKTLRVEAGVRASVELALRRGVPLTGRVRDDNGRAIEGARIRVNGIAVASTDDRGEYDAGPHAGEMRVSVWADGYATARQRIRVSEVPVDTEWRLLEADGVLNGQVLGGNERPLEGVRVTIHPEAGRSRTMFTDGKGVFEFEGVPRGSADVIAEYGALIPHRSDLVIGSKSSLRIVLAPGWTTSVVVRWRSTTVPVEGAVVRAGGQRMVTNAKGEAALAGLVRERVRIDVSSPEASGTHVVLRRSKAENEVVVIELAEGGALRGRVADYRGDPVGHASVEVRSPGAAKALATVRANGRGVYGFEGLPPGDVEVRASPPDDSAEVLAPEVVRSDIRRGHVTDDVDFRLPRR